MKKSTKCILFTLGASAAAIYTYNKFIEKTASEKDLLSDAHGSYYEWKYGNIFYTKQGSGSPVLLIHDTDASSSSINICYFKLSVRNLGSLCSNWGLAYSIIVLSVFFLYTFSCLLALNILIQLFLLKQAVNCSLHSFSQLWPMEVGPDYWTNWQFLIPCGCSFLIRNLSFVRSWMDSYCHL